MLLLCISVVLVACAYGQLQPNITEWEAHLKIEVERLWIELDYNSNGGYDLYDIHQFIRDYDTNGDNVVNKEEFYKRFDMTEPVLAKLHDGLFNEYDNNMDGNVTRSDIEALYDRMDTDKDGTIAKVEFIKYYTDILTMFYLMQFTTE